MTEEGSRNMFEGMFGVHEKEESKPKAKEKANNKKKEKITKKIIEYNDKEKSYIDKYLKIAKTAYDEEEIFEIIKKYNFDDDLITKDINRQLNLIEVKGDEYGWSEVKKKEVKPKQVNKKEKNNKDKKILLQLKTWQNLNQSLTMNGGEEKNLKKAQNYPL